MEKGRKVDGAFVQTKIVVSRMLRCISVDHVDRYILPSPAINSKGQSRTITCITMRWRLIIPHTRSISIFGKDGRLKYL